MSSFLPTLFFVGLFLLALIITFSLGYQASVDLVPLRISVEEPLLHKFVNSALGVFPKKVALGSSHNITLRFAFSDKCRTDSNVASAGPQSQYVEAELQAAALKG